jgi:hypothetical protein
MSSGFSIKTLETKAVVPNNVPRIVCGRTNFQIAPINASILSNGDEFSVDEAAAMLLLCAPENAFVLIFLPLVWFWVVALVVNNDVFIVFVVVACECSSPS